MATQKNIQRGFQILFASLAFSMATISMPAVADELVEVAVESAPAPKAELMSAKELKQLRRMAKKGLLSAEETAKLLESIPEDHPLRADLRRIASSAPPEGFSADQWLKLSMKFDFRGAGSSVARADAQEY